MSYEHIAQDSFFLSILLSSFFLPSIRLRLVTIPSLPIDSQLRWWQHDFSRTTVLKSIGKFFKDTEIAVCSL